METAFEALPQRDSKRLRKRARAGTDLNADESAGASRNVMRRGEDGGRIIYDTSRSGELQYEFLDHTADVQLHACEYGDRPLQNRVHAFSPTNECVVF